MGSTIVGIPLINKLLRCSQADLEDINLQSACLVHKNAMGFLLGKLALIVKEKEEFFIMDGWKTLEPPHYSK